MNTHLYTIRKKGDEGQVVKLSCHHADSWPPSSALLGGSPERLRQKKVITEATYEAHKVWMRKCGKTKMDDGCANCDLARAKARVITRGTGRIRYKDIEFAAFMKTARTDIQLVFEKQDASETSA
jgi:hypothetical protein